MVRRKGPPGCGCRFRATDTDTPSRHARRRRSARTERVEVPTGHGRDGASDRTSRRSEHHGYEHLNWTLGETLPSLAVVELSSAGTVDLYNAAGTTEVIVDVAGWYQ